MRRLEPSLNHTNDPLGPRLGRRPGYRTRVARACVRKRLAIFVRVASQSRLEAGELEEAVAGQRRRDQGPGEVGAVYGGRRGWGRPAQALWGRETEGGDVGELDDIRQGEALGHLDGGGEMTARLGPVAARSSQRRAGDRHEGAFGGELSASREVRRGHESRGSGAFWRSG